MRRPVVDLRARRGRGQHPGLILTRYLAEQNDEGRDRRELFAAACAAARDPSLVALYRRAFERWRGGLGGVAAVADVQTPASARLIVGMGNKGVVEAGLRLHHTYGVPLVPGSALKGLAAHHCHEVYGADDARYRRGQDFHDLLFGKTDDGGVIRFEDAWMHPDSLGAPGQGLLADVMTPHHQKWQTDEDAAPTDFDSPVPVPFLSVAGRFHLAVCWQGPESAQAEAWTKRAMELLQAALADGGAGGKTSSGYGRLVRAEPGPVTAAAHPSAQGGGRPPAPPAGPQLKPNMKVTAKVVADPKDKRRPFAECQGLVGNILNVPAGRTLAAGEEVELLINSVNVALKQIAFKWPG